MILTGELSIWSLWCPAIQGGNWRLFTYIFALTAHFSISQFMDLGKVLFLHQSRRCLYCPVMCQILGNSWQGVQHFAQILQTLTAGRHTSCNFDKVATYATDRHRHQFSWVFVPARLGNFGHELINGIWTISKMNFRSTRIILVEWAWRLNQRWLLKNLGPSPWHHFPTSK